MPKAGKNIAVIILAAGYSSRMKKIKALLPLREEESLLKACINTCRQVGIEKENIFLVLGHEHEQIKKSLKDECVCLVNKDFKEGMFSSVFTGLSALVDLKDKLEASFLLPVDAALVHSRTLSTLLQVWKKKQEANAVLIPSFFGQEGHPPLIGAGHFQKICDYYKEYSSSGKHLQTYFASFVQKDLIDISDAGILSDIDTEEEYLKALKFLEETQDRSISSIEESWHILKYSGQPESLQRHCFAVARMALRLALVLEKQGIKIDLHACVSAGLLHDICHDQPKHAQKGAEFLLSLGFEKLASIVAQHTNPSAYTLQRIAYEEGTFQEEKYSNFAFYPLICLYLADKFVYGSDEFIGIDKRFKIMKAFVKEEEESAEYEHKLKKIKKRKKTAKAMAGYFYELTGLEPEKIALQETGHILESRLQALERELI